jgi:teichuronic acid exporter
VLFFLLGNADMAIVGRVLGGEPLGIYSVAVAISTLPLEKVLPTVAQVSFAAFSRMQTAPERLRRNVVRGARLVSLLLSPAFLGLAAVAPEAIPLVLGAKWQAAVLPIQLLCVVLPVRAVAALFQPALFAIGRPGVNVANMAVTLGIMTLAFLTGARYGVIGVALAWVVAYPIAFTIAAVRATRALGLATRQVVSVAARPALASVLMAVGIMALGAALGDAVAPVPGLVLRVLAGAAIYAGVLWFLDREAIEDLRRILRA